jgi:prepilin-type N-terminal cleavage/methylation domain-containing protein/prepilin-type processing-associated H-X9-DG protein
MVLKPSSGRTRSDSPKKGVLGFTLVELMVVIVVIAIMAALLLPALNRTKEQAKGAACRSNMKQLSLAFLMYAEDNDDTLPWPGGEGRAIDNPTDYAPDWCATPAEMRMIPFSAASANLPGFGHNAECGSIFLYVTSQPRRAFDATDKTASPVYRCPSASALGEALRVNYSANGWTEPGTTINGEVVVPPKGVRMSGVTDPSRKVMLLNEDPRGMKTPAFDPRNPGREVEYHLNRANVGFMDGHMESIQKKEFFQMRSSRDVGLYFNPTK